MKNMKLLKLGSQQCGPCQALARARTLEKFVEAHPDVELSLVDIDDEDGEEIADAYGVQAVPTIIFESTSGGGVLAREEGSVNRAQLEKLYEKAKKKLAATAAEGSRTP